MITSHAVTMLLLHQCLIYTHFVLLKMHDVDSFKPFECYQSLAWTVLYGC